MYLKLTGKQFKYLPNLSWELNIMKVLLVNSGIFRVPPEKGGGTETHVYHLANNLSKLGVEVHLVSDIYSKEALRKDINVYELRALRIPLRMGFTGWVINHFLCGLYSFKKTFETMRGEVFDVIHMHGRLGPVLITILDRRIPKVYTVHDLPPWLSRYGRIEQIVRNISYINMEVKTCRLANYIIVVNPVIRRILVEDFKIPSWKIEFIPNGVDTDLFKPANRKLNYCLFVGNLTWRKGLHILLYALKKLNDEVKCLIVGEGPEKRNLVKLAEKLGLRNVVFTGALPLENLAKIYSKAGFFILPSISEAFGLAALEAMASGCPCIVSSSSGVSKIVRDEYNGYIFKQGDIDMLADKIGKLWTNSSLRRRMGENARNTVEKYSWIKTAEKIVKIYEKQIYK